MKLSSIRDFLRGYSDEDVERAARKLEDHNLHPGCIIPMTGKEMRAVVGAGLMPVFLHVRSVDRLEKLTQIVKRDSMNEQRQEGQ